MRIQRSWVMCVLTIIALVIGVHAAEAQSQPFAGAQSLAPQYYPSGGPGAYAPGGYATPAAYGQQPTPATPYYDPAQGMPPQTLAPMQAAPMGDPSMPMDGGIPEGAMGDAGCPSCGGYGCPDCAAGCDDFDLSILRWLLPYGPGGCGVQRWYDVSAEWVSLSRDEIGAYTVYTTEGQAGTPVLTSDQLGFDATSGVRVSFAMQLGAGNNIETTYIGGFNWASQASAFSADNRLFSIMSQYGEAPFGGFDETDESQSQSVEYSSDLNSVSMDYRQRWVDPNVKVQGSWLVGVRYFELQEDFRYKTFSPINNGFMDYLCGTNNAMTGAQVGGDLWICIMPGLQVGTEGRIGLYGNHASQRTLINATRFVEPVYEKVSENAAAFMGDASFMLLWRISQNWTFKAGYMVLWADSVALATDNFNPAPPFVQGQRIPIIDNSSDVLYHGATLGLEYLW